MLDKLVEGAFRKLGQTLKEVEARSNSPLEYLREAIPAYICFGVENPDEYRLAFLLWDACRQADMFPSEKRQAAGLQELAVLENHIADGLGCGALHGSASSPRLLPRPCGRRSMASSRCCSRIPISTGSASTICCPLTRRCCCTASSGAGRAARPFGF